MRARNRGHETARLFAAYAVASALPVIALGFILAANFRAEARQRGLDQGRDEAALITRTAVQPLLDDRRLRDGIDPGERARLRRLTSGSIGRDLLRLRVRDTAGRVVYSDDGSGLGGPPDDEAIDAAHGEVVARLTRLDADGADDDDAGRPRTLGPRAVEIYLPLHAGRPARTVGVLELYLPYAPIDRDVSRLLSTLYRDLAIGLGALYLALFAITASVSRRLQRAAARNAYLADHDTLTGLPNRSCFARRAAEALAAAHRDGAEVAIAIVDLDRFQDINDTLGHHVGDVVLRELARRLEAECGDEAIVARLGGDEYGLVLQRGPGIGETLWRVRRALDRDVEVAGVVLAAQASIGYAIAPFDGDDVDTLVRRADVAVYAAKALHAGVTRYEPSLDEHDAESLRLVAELRHAIDRDELVLHYQPQQRVHDGEIVALEALVRWQHPEHGLLFPDRFLPLAEQTDVIDRLTEWVLRRALRDIGALDEPGAPPRVAVNVSARSIGRGRLADDVIHALAALGVEPGRLIIEVTETAILADPGRAARELERLARAGVQISLDDFGRGQTSIGYLSTLPLHELKIDRSFVGDMDADHAHAAIVRAMIDLGHSLGLHVVAEGVETECVAALLRDGGSDLIQGYLLARPLPLADLRTWLSGRTAGDAATIG